MCPGDVLGYKYLKTTLLGKILQPHHSSSSGNPFLPFLLTYLPCFLVCVLIPSKFELQGLDAFVSEFPRPKGGNPACSIDAAPVSLRAPIPDPADRVTSRGPDESVVELTATPDPDSRVPSPRPKEPVVDEGPSDAESGLHSSPLNIWSFYRQTEPNKSSA